MTKSNMPANQKQSLIDLHNEALKRLDINFYKTYQESLKSKKNLNTSQSSIEKRPL